ncbi:MAG: hypothetical protein K8F91_27190, partial [Candidatus Obscuribacterales bacterium]|nr:hypothetical protein [Candidatus Obscuribacterales bacterium]
GYLLCRQPKDEASRLVKALEKLACHKRNKVDYELSEPCFSIKLKRQEDSGLQVVVFVDAGNVETGISRWDALGIRFFTNQTKLEQFIKELKQDFAC